MSESKDLKVQDFLSGLERESRKPDRSKRKARANFSGVEAVLPAVLNKLGLEQRLKEHAVLQVWTGLLPDSLKERCRPLFIDRQNQLVLAVADAAVAQELSLLKGKLLQQLRVTCKSLGYEISGLRLDMKSFHKILRQENEQEPENLALPKASHEALAALELSDYDKQLILELSKQLAAEDADPNFSQKALQAFEAQLRLVQWRKANGFPVCGKCANPVSRLYEVGKTAICFKCKIESSE